MSNKVLHVGDIVSDYDAPAEIRNIKTTAEYDDFLRAKLCAAPRSGFDVDPAKVSDRMKPHCRAIVPWMLAGGRRALFTAFGLHKAQPVSEPVLTPTGWRPIGELIPGDQVITVDGSVTAVTGVYPQGERPIVRLRFSDGASTRCDLDHLWSVHTDSDAFRDRPWRTMRLRDIIETGLIEPSGRLRWRIPVMGSADLPRQSLPIDPYVMGVILGDGTFRRASSVSFSSADTELVEMVAAALPAGMNVVKESSSDSRCPAYRLSIPRAGIGRRNPIVTALRDFGLWGLKSSDKFVPEMFIAGSRDQRLAVLQGLMDADGNVSPDGAIRFGSSSKALVDAVIALVRSLGGIARRNAVQKTSYKRNGKSIAGQDHEQVSIALPDGTIPFRLTRKASACAPRVKYPPLRKISGCVDDGSEQSVCISVAHESQLYVTRDYVVTHNTVMQLEAVRLACEHIGGRGLIVIPLGVRQEFRRDAVERLGWPEAPKFIRRIEEAGDTGIYLTNYETIRDGKLDPRLFQVASLDEASILRGFGGTKTFREFMALFAGDDRRDRTQRVKTDGLRFRFVATATPSPNEYIELLAYAAFLGIMDVPAAKTRWFKRDSTKADKLTILPHKEEEFWLWVSTWAMFLQKPSDLGPEYSDDGYDLPELDVRWHEIPSDHSQAGYEKDGQALMFANPAISISNTAREKRSSMDARIARMMEIRAEDPDAHRIIWHDLEDERREIERAIPDVVSVYGSQDQDEREQYVVDFSDGRSRELAAKPRMLGSGCNLQRHCNWAIYLGIGFKFNDWIQSVHRILRFGQTKRVRIDLIYTESERMVREALQRKWNNHVIMVGKMTEIIREYGLANSALIGLMARSMGVSRIETSGEHYRCINNDSVKETAAMEDNSIDHIVTSIPFSTQYEYSPNYADFGHTDDNAHFWRQMDFLIPSLLRILKPGRVAAIHVKDRIQPGGINGFGFQTVEPFSDECIAAFRKHGFAFLSRKTIVTDVVRENAQTYRLGWSEQCKDGSRMGAGMPEYLLIFRKPPTDLSNGYADNPVVKLQPEVLDKLGARIPYEGNRPMAQPLTDGSYSRGRWQFDAHGFMRSSGNRLMMPDELDGLDQAALYQMFKRHSLHNVYDFEHDVKIADAVDETGWLPTTFMLLQPASWHPDVWTDITRMRTMNTLQGQKGAEQHICPLQFDIVDRCIDQYSMAGETILDPFAGLMTVPYCAIKKGRKGVGIELSSKYWLDGVGYCKAAEEKRSMPDLIEMLELMEKENAI